MTQEEIIKCRANYSGPYYVVNDAGADRLLDEGVPEWLIVRTKTISKIDRKN